MGLIVNHICRRSAELLVAFNHFVHCLQEVLLSDCLPSSTNCIHSCFSAYTAYIRPCCHPSYSWVQTPNNEDPAMDNITIYHSKYRKRYETKNGLKWTCGIGAKSRQQLKAYTTLTIHCSSVNFEDLCSTVQIWQPKFHFPVQPSRSKKCWV